MRFLFTTMTTAALLCSGTSLAMPKPLHAPEPPLLPKLEAALVPLDQPPRAHQRLFDTNEVAFGMPSDMVPRTAILTAALRDLDRAARQGWLELPAQARAAENRYRGWLALLRDLKGEPRAAQLAAINLFVNAQPYRSDGPGRDDWQAPWRFLTSTGDCEEYVITKYASLRHLGVPPERLRIVVARETARQEYHAVLAVKLDDDILILDNRTNQIRSQEQIRHLDPVYSFDEKEILFHWRDGEPAPTVFSTTVLQAAAK